MKKRLTRNLLIVGGTLCVALATLGLFLPVLPTTPFLLLAAVCYACSSERFYYWLLSNRWFGAYIRNYRDSLASLRSRHVLVDTTKDENGQCKPRS